MAMQAVYINNKQISAETNCNKLKIIQGQKNSEDFFKDIENVNELTKLGCAQSILLAKKLAKVKFDEIIMSDMKRTELTAEEIIKLTDRKNLKVRKSELLREKNYGVFSGKSGELYKHLVNV
jgi:broad specificity phosphatase PhoE